MKNLEATMSVLKAVVIDNPEIKKVIIAKLERINNSHLNIIVKLNKKIHEISEENKDIESTMKTLEENKTMLTVKEYESIVKTRGKLIEKNNEKRFALITRVKEHKSVISNNRKNIDVLQNEDSE